ncbi:hypothetical protein CEP54_013045 [Fusarium duplospermum]|uniref:Uncharacterized protein n=1 Tax=Fusarium duplospermum TaxID=1325734 RepID=A0A428P5A1_9HYPO|nr:hypothetical protein CEP54_013045 [Fusarium duplospermum]
MSHQRRSSTSQTYQGHRRCSQHARSRSDNNGVARSAPTSGIVYTPGSVHPDDFYDRDEFEVADTYTEEPEALQDTYTSPQADTSGSYPDTTQYASQDVQTAGSYPGGVAYTRGGTYAGGNTHTRGGSYDARNYSRGYDWGSYSRSGTYSAGNYARGGTYPGRDNRVFSYTRDGYLIQNSEPRRRFPDDHYDGLGNYIGAPPIYSSTTGFTSFPRYPEPEVPSSPSPPPPPPAPAAQNNRRSLSGQLVDGVRSLFSPEPASSEPQVPPQPARTGVYLFCRHRLNDDCACITPLEDNEPGDYCQKCWEGRCKGPRPPGSTPKRSFW